MCKNNESLLTCFHALNIEHNFIADSLSKEALCREEGVLHWEGLMEGTMEGSGYINLFSGLC